MEILAVADYVDHTTVSRHADFGGRVITPPRSNVRPDAILPGEERRANAVDSARPSKHRRISQNDSFLCDSLAIRVSLVACREITHRAILPEESVSRVCGGQALPHHLAGVVERARRRAVASQRTEIDHL